MGKGKNKQPVEKAEMKSEEKKEEKNTGNSNKEIVLKVFMHCEGCCQKVSRCLKRLDGVEDVVIDSANRMVVVKGKNADPLKALQTLQKKYSRNVELISPKLKPEDKNKKKEPEKKQEVQVKVVVLKMYMHCEGCANDIKKCIERMKGILNVETNNEMSRVIVKGAFDPPKLVESIKKRLRKHVEIVKQEQGEKVGSQGNGNDNKKGTEGGINVFYYPPQYSAQHICPNQMFSDENVYSCSIM